MSPEIASLVMFALVIAFIILGCPVAIALGGMAVIFGFAYYGVPAFTQFAIATWSMTTAWSMVAVTLFIFMGTLLQRSGVADKLFEALHILMGGVNGGLALATMVIATIFAACTGIAGASVVTIGLLALPVMLRHGYSDELASGTICAGGGLGVIIPPSIVLIIYGPNAGVSIADLFAASLVPGLILSACYLTYIGIRCYLKPESGPAMPPEERKFPRRTLLSMIAINLFPPALLILAVLGAILFGIAAPTEAASLGTVGAIAICAAQRRLNWQTLKAALYDTVRICAMVLFIVVGAKIFTSVFLRMGGSRVVQNAITGLALPHMGTIIVMLSINVLLGFVFDWIGIIFILVPTYIPILQMLGVDPLWFGTLFCICLQISYMTPPFAYSIFYLRGIAPPEVTLSHMYRGAIPFLAIQLMCLALLIAFPQLSLWFPSLFR